jgi:hypothetical protein
MLFSWLTEKRVLPIKPARGDKNTAPFARKEGKTPALRATRSELVLESTDTRHAVSHRDKALLATVAYACNRNGAAVGKSARLLSGRKAIRYSPVGTEVGARDLVDIRRYNVLPMVGKHLGLDTRSDRSLWKDRALVELNAAVLHSFAQAGVAMVDHHTVARQFMLHEEREMKAGRTTHADWSWIVPPLSGSTTPVFHKAFENKVLSPNFYHQPAPWRSEGPRQDGCPFGFGAALE